MDQAGEKAQVGFAVNGFDKIVGPLNVPNVIANREKSTLRGTYALCDSLRTRIRPNSFFSLYDK